MCMYIVYICLHSCYMCVYMYVFVSIYVYIQLYGYVCACILVYAISNPCLTCSLAVSLACLHDDVRAEPGSWLVVGMIPIFDRKKAERAGRPDRGPNGAPRRRIHLTHQCLEFLLEGWNALTEGNKVIQWADGLWRRTRIMLAAIIMDQPETDVYCCDTAQSCKLCNCPKCKLHEPIIPPNMRTRRR